MLIDTETVATGVAGLGGLTVAGRWFFSWWSKQNHADKLDERQSKLVEQMQSQHKEHVEALNGVIKELREETAALKAEVEELKKQTRDAERKTILLEAIAYKHGIDIQAEYAKLEASDGGS